MSKDEYIKNINNRTYEYCLGKNEDECKYPSRYYNGLSRLMILNDDKFIYKIIKLFINLIFINDIYNIRKIIYNNVEIEENDNNSILLFEASDYHLNKKNIFRKYI